jgi:hypothetical protein
MYPISRIMAFVCLMTQRFGVILAKRCFIHTFSEGVVANAIVPPQST